ncbi:gamma-secretase subunit PEN-2 isoform A [Alligator mississippiensis]|uniref:Gamma-secretase subunit PEN-2 isoform A n=1 Tax=Alligator mississippiensis TaxID=8496 RepID=A0A151NRU4_ALLMI|nr:gamma-secretase subunit PEN-2 isoform A [Alligator mississippiensis]
MAATQSSMLRNGDYKSRRSLRWVKLGACAVRGLEQEEAGCGCPCGSAKMNLERVPNEEKLNLCRKYYLGGFALLPFLWLGL